VEKLPLGTAVSETDWQRLPLDHRFTAASLAETLDGGQSFRWSFEESTCTWTGIWGSEVVSLRLDPPNLWYASPTGTPEAAIGEYLATQASRDLASRLPLPSDPVLQRLQARWSGLSLLAQPPGEALLAFLCSSNKQIVQIRRMVAALARHFGSPIPGTPHFALPDWSTLLAASRKDLLACGLGYRARSVEGSARFLAEQPGFLEAITGMPYAEAHTALQQLPGVGPKVADCVLLFGYRKTEAFPVDTWIEKMLLKSYPQLAGFSRKQLAVFGRLHFGEAAGLAQQWLFAEARNPLSQTTSNGLIHVPSPQ
jgi:N-glycosylase/DNA lyase